VVGYVKVDFRVTSSVVARVGFRAKRDFATPDKTGAGLQRQMRFGGVQLAEERGLSGCRRSESRLTASFIKSLVAGAGASTLGFSLALARAGGVENVVFVHGLYADRSCWSELIARLNSAGKRITSVQTDYAPLRAMSRRLSRCS
jgi:hypothetical protein